MHIMTDIKEIADAVTRRAQRQGFVIPREIREELTGAGLAPDLWKDVLALAQPSLNYRQGRYYFISGISARMEQEQEQQRVIQRAVRQLIRQYKAEAAQIERRQHGRVDFILPVKVQTDDHRELTLLSRDISKTGIRLIGTRSLLGQKVRVLIPRGDGAPPRCFVVRIVWTCAIGDEMFENGGNFLEVIAPQPEPLRVVS
jgi:hypothetical protein